MLPDLGEIKARRRELHMTQAELAARSGVSQSLIAKIERRQLMPAYDRVKRIYDALSEAREERQILAKHVMKKKVLHVSSRTAVKKAVALMRRKGVSQLPVMESGKVVGTLSEKELLHRMEAARNLEAFGKQPVQSIMQESMPIIQENLPHEVISSLLDYHPAVLVGSRGNISGIITKTDLLNMLGKKGTARKRS